MKSRLPVRVYKRVKSYRGEPPGVRREEFLVKFQVFLRDRPGSLASFSSLIASLEKGRYVLEKTKTALDSVDITTIENVLEIKVKLANKPGSLASFSRLLRKYQANVLYMLYDEGIDADSADVAMATKNPAEIDRLLDGINKEGYLYRVLYRGAGEKEIEHIIGLKLVEKFFLRLRGLLKGKAAVEVKALVDSSQELQADLVKFYSEAGNHLDEADVFEKVLTLASLSRSRTGRKFSSSEMPAIRLGPDTTLLGFRLPTTENIYVFVHGGELTMVDSGFGIYYEDIKTLLEEKSLDPSAVRRIFVTHPDADHAGSSGHFQAEFGADVYMHPAGKEVIAHDNRAYGIGGKLAGMNRYYTRLVNKFTDCRFAEHIRWFETQPMDKAGGFVVIDSFFIGDLQCEVLQSRGGHVPGHVFFLNRGHGLLFSSDYLINVGSLSREDKNHLGLYKYLLISPNGNDLVFKEETAALKELVISLDQDLKQKGRNALVLPGHGDYYRAEGLRKQIARQRGHH
jgi:glyoxylase-like metal-dependent hydrolase (beta-lactamase superfamily II)